jgi:dTDP-4-dehydrorhamnose 3,5-epimerase
MGCILDVSVDIRPTSSSYGRYCKIILSENNQYQLFVPKGFAHGFSVLSEKAIVEYKCDEFYHKECESGINYNDPYLSIDWQINNGNIIVSEKDSKLPFISNKLQRRSNDTRI